MRALRYLLLVATLSSLAARAVAEPAPLTRERFVASLASDLSSHFNLEGDLQLDFIRPWSPPARLAEIWTIEITEYPTVPSASMLVRCRVLADSIAVADATLVLRAALWRDVWAARQPLAKDSTFDPAVLDTRRVDLLREREALPVNVGDRSYSFARTIGSGRLLTWHDIARRPLVRKGDLVEVSAVEGQLLITMQAMAMENGSQGETVTVRNPVSRRDFAATVVDENRVQVRF
ncbi:flagellar basal body P-ring formation chaperone FlgA [Opitutus terrae]|uniref:Flagella basal body P-ring formation protein FlgA n=1 Tax=Opitutus terrae (strain DSM 11246 / JCM 15787 / PB90-1) TaxID=452637 RepID=B1ZR19_OPITP|nr:flagellar basal body P-ring formation chaperone FlgA [Opitutus terrae]ACB73686.1 Flagellar basal body P-ring biosynthesis protein-like protein [Opitutus terrae PB90-1]